MCTAFIASTAISVLTTGIQYVGQMKQASQQAAYEQQRVEQQNTYMLENAAAARRAAVEQMAAENIRTGQQQEAAAVEVQDMQRERARAQGTARASSEGRGLSVDMLMRDFYREEARSRDRINRQLQFDIEQSARRMTGYQADAQNRINAVQPYTPAPVNYPSAFGAGLTMLGSGVGNYFQFASKNPKTGNYEL